MNKKVEIVFISIVTVVSLVVGIFFTKTIVRSNKKSVQTTENSGLQLNEVKTGDIDNGSDSDVENVEKNDMTKGKDDEKSSIKSSNSENVFENDTTNDAIVKQGELNNVQLDDNKSDNKSASTDSSIANSAIDNSTPNGQNNDVTVNVKIAPRIDYVYKDTNRDASLAKTKIKVKDSIKNKNIKNKNTTMTSIKQSKRVRKTKLIDMNSTRNHNFEAKDEVIRNTSDHVDKNKNAKSDNSNDVGKNVDIYNTIIVNETE